MTVITLDHARAAMSTACRAVADAKCLTLRAEYATRAAADALAISRAVFAAAHETN